MAKIELYVLYGQCLNRHISTMEMVEDEVRAWNNAWNNNTSNINWQFTATDARIKLKGLYPS